MPDQFARTRLLIGEAGVKKLKESTVAVFGVGGVGGFAVEALARAGIGHLVLVDNDEVSVTNINRQIIATWDTVGRPKTEVMRERCLSINPELKVEVKNCFFLPENAEEFSFYSYDYIIDAVDTVTAKIELVLQGEKHHVPVISSMGAGNRLDPAGFEVADIYETSVCPLARVMRRELKARKIDHLKVVYSREQPLKPLEQYREEDPGMRRSLPGSISFVPSAAGLVLAGEVVRDLLTE